MPKLFASEIVIHDRETGEKIPARVEVNHPCVTAASRSTSPASTTAAPASRCSPCRWTAAAAASRCRAPSAAPPTPARAGRGAQKMTLEYTGLRVMNVENLASARQRRGRAQGGPARVAGGAPGRSQQDQHKKALRNVGPSITYKLRDAAGQAREFHNYMLPMDLGDGVPVFLLGVRETPAKLPLPAHAGRRERRAGRLPALRAALADRRCARRPCAVTRPSDRPAPRAGGAAGGVEQPRAGAVRGRRSGRRPPAGGCRRCPTSWKRTCPRPSDGPAKCWCAS